MLFSVTLHASCLLCKTCLLRFMHAPSKSSQQHEKNASQNMRKGQNLQIAPSKPCLKKSPTSFKKSGSYSFQGSDEDSQLPSRSGLFLGSNPPPNGQDMLKKPLFGHNIRQLIKIIHNRLKNPFLNFRICLSPQRTGARPQTRSHANSYGQAPAL
jgi:hypothetical protein